jgi:dipeptidyl aminopeptidase/acylaminoacyl peptidase
VIDLTTGSLRSLDTPFTQFASLRAHGDQVPSIAGASSHPARVVVFDLSSDRILKKATDILDRADLRIGEYLTPVEPIELPTSAGRAAFGLFYPPHNADCAAPEGEKPPLLVKCHGGPTSTASSTLNLGIQYWTSRGIAVLDVSYGGSSGFGRAYRDRLQHNWGVVDVDDCINGAKFLAERGSVDANRMVIDDAPHRGHRRERNARTRPRRRCWRVPIIALGMSARPKGLLFGFGNIPLTLIRDGLARLAAVFADHNIVRTIRRTG